MKTIRALVVDDHALLRRGLATLFRLQKEIVIVGEAANGVEAVEQAKALRPDVVVMDLSMPVMDGVEATKQIRASHPEVRVLIMTTFGTSVDVMRAVRFGASGAIVKDSEFEDLLSAIRTVANGGTVFTPEIESMLETEDEPPELTRRQQEILESIMHGLASDAIAAKLGISTPAVNQHINAIRTKLGAANRTEAVAIALRKHLLKI